MLLIRNFTSMLFLNYISTSLTAYSGTSSTVWITVCLPHIKTVYAICGMVCSSLSEFLYSYFSFSIILDILVMVPTPHPTSPSSWIFPTNISHQGSSSRLFSALNIDRTREHNFSRGSLPTDFWATHQTTGLEGIHPFSTY